MLPDAYWRVLLKLNLACKLIELFNSSFVFAYYTQYAFLREFIFQKNGLHILDENIDEFIF